MTQFDGVGKPDFILLDDISEDSFMKNLQERFENARIYTYIGETVVSINPYRELDIYNDKTVEEYRNREIFERPPHVFALADAAFQDMKWRQKNACIVISGLCFITMSHTSSLKYPKYVTCLMYSLTKQYPGTIYVTCMYLVKLHT